MYYYHSCTCAEFDAFGVLVSIQFTESRKPVYFCALGSILRPRVVNRAGNTSQRQGQLQGREFFKGNSNSQVPTGDLPDYAYGTMKRVVRWINTGTIYVQVLGRRWGDAGGALDDIRRQEGSFMGS
ncbi:hypothetical protein CC2G_000159 [Coprinopsis cinerea AmutBmut pab1-1]|nr:hypothetical protein CC2G_000159 [Coprinopsis cinerea AmutBmut pab1-1]